jgi:hypothetical protein
MIPLNTRTRTFGDLQTDSADCCKRFRSFASMDVCSAPKRLCSTVALPRSETEGHRTAAVSPNKTASANSGPVSLTVSELWLHLHMTRSVPKATRYIPENRHHSRRESRYFSHTSLRFPPKRMRVRNWIPPLEPCESDSQMHKSSEQGSKLCAGVPIVATQLLRISPKDPSLRPLSRFVFGFQSLPSAFMNWSMNSANRFSSRRPTAPRMGTPPSARTAMGPCPGAATKSASACICRIRNLVAAPPTSKGCNAAC